MNTLTLPTLDTQLSTIELELQQLNSAIAQKKALKKAIAAKKETAIKVLSKLESALLQVSQSFEQLGESAAELKAIALNKIGEYFHEIETEPNGHIKLTGFPRQSCPLLSEDNLVQFPQQQNDSNDFFSWQLTSNPALASYFNVAKGVPQSTYIGANNKQNLKTIGVNLQNLFEISFEIRKATRLTDFNYELKITGLDDDAIGWLTQFDFSQKFYPQFACILQKPEIAPELKLTENNWIAAPGAAIVNNLFPCICHLVETDNFGTGIAKNESGKQFEIHLDDWHLTQDFQREAEFTYQAIKACNSKEELEIIKKSNQIAEDFLKFVWLAMPEEEKNRIKELCEPKNFKKNKVSKTAFERVVLELPSGLAHYKEIAQVVLEEIANFYTITVNRKRAKDVSCWNLIAQSGAKAKLYLSQGFEWTIEPFKKGEQLSDCFPEDIADFLANNDVFVDELYQQIA